MDGRIKPEDLEHSFEIEPLFDEFVQIFGGKRVSALLGPSPSFDNADYIFETDCVIAELKCLQNDYAASQKIEDKAFELYRKWMKEGSMSFRMIFHPRELPFEKRRELRRLYSEPLRRIVKKANRQLRETARNLSVKEPKKLLIIANDGLYSMESRLIVSTVCDILQREFSSIHGFVYLTVNTYVGIPDDNYARQLWVPAYHEEAPADLPGFVNRLGEQWFEFFDTQIGGFDTVPIKTEDPSFVREARFIRSSPPEQT